MKTRAIVFAGAVALAIPAHAADAPKVTSQRIFSGDTTIAGQKIDVPQNPNVVATLAIFPPGAALPVHRHPYPHYVYVLEGTLTITNSQTGKVTTAKPGEFFIEMNNTWHFGKNDGTVPVKLLTIDQLPVGATSNIELKDAK